MALLHTAQRLLRTVMRRMLQTVSCRLWLSCKWVGSHMAVLAYRLRVHVTTCCSYSRMGTIYVYRDSRTAMKVLVQDLWSMGFARRGSCIIWCMYLHHLPSPNALVCLFFLIWMH